MDYILQYTSEQKVIEAINYVYLLKKMILPYKLVGFEGTKVTREMREWQEQSTIIWKVKFDVVPKPHKRLVEVQKAFVEWMSE